jgi:hypothetical protein
MTSPSQDAPAGGRLRFRVPADLEPTYANLAAITHSPSEILIDFAQVMPMVPEARVKSRIVLTPTNAKLLLNALRDHLGRFETQFGEIRLPEAASLAEHLFRPPTTGGQGPTDEQKEGQDE